MTEKGEPRALIIGAGISGLAAAYYLKQAGMAVTVFDKTDATHNCSFGNAGLIAPRYITPLASPGVISEGLLYMLKKESPFYIHPRLNKDLISWLWKFKKAATEEKVKAAGPVLRDVIRRNQELLEAFEKKGEMEFGYHKNGHMTICETNHSLEKEKKTAEKANELGVTARILSAAEVFEMEPNVPKNTIGASYYPGDAHLNPNRLMTELRKLLESRGVEFVLNTEIKDIAETGDSEVQVMDDSRKMYKGNYVVVCGGAWTQDLMKKLGANIPIQAGKGYSITLKNPPRITHRNFTMAEKKVAVTPIGNAMRFAGTMEIVGRDMSVTVPKVNAIKKAILDFYPEYTMADLDKEEIWVGLRPCSADGMPYIGRVNPYKNIFISSGYSMVGMSLSFAAGEILEQLMTRGEADLSSPLIDPNRFK